MRSAKHHDELWTDDHSSDSDEQLEFEQGEASGAGADNDAKLKPTMSLFDGVCIIVGIIIGSGIFSSPGVVMSDAGSAQMTLMVWLSAGILCLWGSLCYAELGVAYPHAGGEYHYFNLAFGGVGGFFFTWSNLFVYRTGSIAIIALIFSRYVGSVVLGIDVTDPELDQGIGIKLLAMGCIAGLTALNCLGVEFGTLIQNVFTVIKLGLMASMLLVGFGYLGTDGAGTLQDNFQNKASDGASVAGFGTAMIAALWAFDGWNNVNYVTEELKNPEVNTLRSILGGLSIVTGSYMVANICYFIVLDAEAIKGSKAIAIVFADRALGGEVAKTMAAVLVGLSAFGAANGSILTGSRAVMAAARDGQLPKVLGRIHSTRGTPIQALAVQGIWSCLLLVPSNFEALLNYFGIVSWLFYGLSGVSLMVLRLKDPETRRPYKVLWYPFTPIMLVTCSLFLILSIVWSDPLPSLLAILFLAVSVPVYYFKMWWGQRESLGSGSAAIPETETELELENTPIPTDDPLSVKDDSTRSAM